ncbi:MAG TPA: DUF4019 domain-containing protein, partial [Steroidobacteraceae bacterium]|nr:DUF4019 domain-containing protein [Steroidobacteraceae bacterium]
MKHVIAWIVAAVALALVPALADEGESVSQAESAALAWLALTDAGAYDQSWDAAASIFRSAITQS